MNVTILEYPVTIAVTVLLGVQLLSGAWGSHSLICLWIAASATEGWILPWLRGRASQEMERAANRVRDELSRKGGGAWTRFQDFLRVGGEAASFSDAELLAVFQGREGELLAAAFLPGESVRGLLRAMAERNAAASQSGPLLEDAVLAACADQPALADDVLEIHSRAGKLDTLLAQVRDARLAALRLAVAGSALRCDRPLDSLRFLDAAPSSAPRELALKREALTRLGRVDEALEILLQRPGTEWSSDDHALALHSFINKGDRQKASDEFKALQNHCAPGRYPETFYAYADFCERTGQRQSAESVFKRLADAQAGYKDVQQRHSRLQSCRWSGDGSVANPSAAPPPVPSGPRLIAGKFELRDRIGEGGMGEVFAGFDVKLQRPVAVKRMRAELRADPRVRDRFLQEARIVSQLAHPYIVKLQDIAEEADGLFLILDFVAGKSLSQVLYEKSRFEPAECRRVLEPVCQAVDYAHAKRVLHRDLKPSNIMIAASGFPMVMDFGLARQAKESLSQLTQVDASGTPAYMAPEQHLGKAEKASDIYSLGVCLYEMLTGDLPFRGADLLAQKERMRFEPPSVHVPGLPRAADSLVARALAARPEDRIREAAELLEELKRL